MKTMRWGSRLIGGLAGLVMIGMAGSANAVLIDNGMSTIDTSTNMEWLDLTKTLGQSYNSVAAGFGGFTTIEGYRFATQSEVSTLFTNAGFVFQDGNFHAIDATAVALMLSLIGCTAVNCNIIGDPFGQGLADLDIFSPTNVGAPFYQAIVGTPGNFNTSLIGSADAFPCCVSKDFTGASIGSWLVREAVAQVPEPSTLAPFLIALGGLGFLMRRRVA